MKLRNRDINVEPSVQALKRVSTKEVSPQVIKRKKVDYDEKLLKNPTDVANFAPGIFKYMQHREAVYQLPSSLKKNITEMNRALIVDWLVDCHDNSSYSHGTMYTAIRLFDIFVAGHQSFSSEKFQLVAASSLLIATKLEEYTPISTATLEKLCEHQYERSEFKFMEIEILKTARGDLSFPLPYSFLRRYSRVISTDMETLTLARFYLEVVTHYMDWALEKPSKIAVVSMVLALKKSESKLDWEPILEQHSGYEMADLDTLVQKLEKDVKGFKTAFPKCSMVISKYSSKTFFEVAKKLSGLIYYVKLY